MPVTRARTCATREASTRPGSSVVSGAVCVVTITTPTSGGGGAAPAPGPAGALCSPPQAASGQCQSQHRGGRDRPDASAVAQEGSCTGSALSHLEVLANRKAPTEGARFNAADGVGSASFDATGFDTRLCVQYRHAPPAVSRPPAQPPPGRRCDVHCDLPRQAATDARLRRLLASSTWNEEAVGGGSPTSICLSAGP